MSLSSGLQHVEFFVPRAHVLETSFEHVRCRCLVRCEMINVERQIKLEERFWYLRWVQDLPYSICLGVRRARCLVRIWLQGRR